MPKPDVSEERKAQIIAAATAVFAEKGFYEARMDDIVEASGLSKGALYWYFDSKDAIIAAILDSFFNQEMAGMEKIATAEMPVAGKLKMLIEQMMADIQDLSIYQSITLEFYSLANRREDVRLSLLDYFKDFQTGLAYLIRQGIDSGEFKPVNANVVASIFIAQLEGIALLWAFNPEHFQLEAVAFTAIDLLLAGLSANTPEAN